MRRPTGDLRQGHEVKDQGELKGADNVALCPSFVARSHRIAPWFDVRAGDRFKCGISRGGLDPLTHCSPSFRSLRYQLGCHAALCWPLHRPTMRGGVRSQRHVLSANKRRQHTIPTCRVSNLTFAVVLVRGNKSHTDVQTAVMFFLFTSILRMCVQNWKFVALAIPEIIGVLKEFRQSLDTPTLPLLTNFKGLLFAWTL